VPVGRLDITKTDEHHSPLARSSTDVLSKPLTQQRFPECDRKDLVETPGRYGAILLRRSAALSLEKMVAAARKDGVDLVVLEGWRSHAAQAELYEKMQALPGTVGLAAPPGWSDHATGYAVDFADGRWPKNDYSFPSSKAYQWLKIHAGDYWFSEPFSESHPTLHKPWHWRFEGDSKSFDLFYPRT